MIPCPIYDGPSSAETSTTSGPAITSGGSVSPTVFSEAGWLPRCVAGPCKESRAQGGIICCWPRGAGYSRVGAGAPWRVPLSERSAPRLPLRQPVSGQWPGPAERVSSDQRVPPPAGPGDQSGHVRLQLTEQRSAQYLRLGGASPAGATAMVTVVSALARWGAAAAPGPA